MLKYFLLSILFIFSCGQSQPEVVVSDSAAIKAEAFDYYIEVYDIYDEDYRVGKPFTDHAATVVNTKPITLDSIEYFQLMEEMKAALSIHEKSIERLKKLRSFGNQTDLAGNAIANINGQTAAIKELQTMLFFMVDGIDASEKQIFDGCARTYLYAADTINTVKEDWKTFRAEFGFTQTDRDSIKRRYNLESASDK